MAASSNADVCLYILAIFLPFLPILIKTGCGCDLLINLLLCMLGWLPGVLREFELISMDKGGWVANEWEC
ncbi:Plasma membrane proteolipid [Lachnellula hyalina]|uniref:Plasma membrane proteolipid n=1 Tax=Lachnellula hyalina TaxID=1316788 RepID=A0A8H8R4F6_9HELO|nr:Plasma membrane proteolipid [Lachnellula hyalina]TVY28248.1 Plasma membrane proteolipid [Lachnellula hyalina]